MYNVSDNFNTLASSNNRTVSCKVNINGTDIDSGLIVSLKFKEASSSGSNISLGEAISNVIELKIYKTDIQLKGAVIKPYISFDSTEYCPLGVFYVSEVSKDKAYIDITAYDKMALLNEKYVPTVTFPCTTDLIVQDIANQCVFEYMLPSYQLPTIEEFNIECTIREMLGYIAGIFGTNAKFNRDGKLEFKFYEDTSITLEDEVFLDGQSDTSEDEYNITALISGSGDNELKIGNGKAITFANPFITSEHLSFIYDNYLPFSYTSAKVQYRGNPAIEIGDVITVKDVDGNSYRIPVMSQEFEFNGGLSATIESFGLSDEMDVISNFKSDTIEVNRKITSLEQMQNKILGADGGYYEVLLDKNDSNRPYGTAWWSDQSKTQGWKFTYGGLGYFNNNTLQHIGITNDGDIVANNIASNGLITNSFTIGKVDSDDTNYAMKFDGNTGKITFGSGVTISWSDIQDTPNNIATKDEIPTNISQLTGSENLATKDEIPTDEYITTISKNAITSEYITGLNLKVGKEIQMGENAVISWGNISDSPTIPTNTSQLTNDSGFATTTYVNNAISGVSGITLPSYITSTKITSTTIESPTISGGSLLSSTIKTDKLYIQKSGYVYDTDESENVRFIYMVGDSTSDTKLRMGRVSSNNYSKLYNSIDFEDSSQVRTITLNTDIVYAQTLAPFNIAFNGNIYNAAEPSAALTLKASAVNSGKNTAGFFRPIKDADTSFKNGIMYLGGASYKWKAIYCATGSILTSDRNLKTNITDLDSKYLDLFDRLQPVQYKLINGDRIHTGFIAQDVETSITEVGLTAEDFGGFCKDLKEDSADEYIYGLRYEEFIAINTAKIKQLEQKIKELEATINSQME